MDARLLARILVTDRTLYGDQGTFARNVARAARRGGATAIILREKDLDDHLLLALAASVLEECNVPVILAHRPDLAAEAGLAGVHLGWNSPSVADARRLLPAEALVGISVHGVEEAGRRAEEMPDYLICGPVLPTASKAGLVPDMGFVALASAAAASPLPLVAIGGLAFEHELEVLGAGATGWAAIRAYADLEERVS